MADKDEHNVALAELGRHFGDISELLLADGAVLQPERVIEFAVGFVPHVGHCGITVLRDGRPPETVAATDAIAAEVDGLQYRFGQGPCLDAAAEDDALITADVARDPRWPLFGPACAAQTGIRSVLSLRMLIGAPDRAALNLYSSSPGAFDTMDLGVASIIAPFAAMSVTTALHERDVTNLGMALVTRRQIGTAIGILMASHQTTPDEAFAMLRSASQHLNRKLRDVAEDVELTGELPQA